MRFAPRSNRPRTVRLLLERLEERALLDGRHFTVSPAVNVTRSSGGQAEATIAIDPTNPDRLFAASNSGMFARYSTNGGETWQATNVAGIPASCCDNQAIADPFGNLFVVYLNNSNFTTVVAWSTNFGQSFAGFAVAVPGDTDQPSIGVGGSDVPGQYTVWASVDVGRNGIRAAGARVTGLGQIGPFSTAQLAPGSFGGGQHGSFGGTSVGPNGEVMVTYQKPIPGPGPSEIFVNTDPDGLGPQPFGPAVRVSGTNVGGFAPIPAQPSRTIDAETNLAWDRSGGPRTGRAYLVYTDRPSVTSADTDIYVRYSDDLGATWTERIRVNDDATQNSQFNPAIAVDQTTGNVAVTWYDARNVLNNRAVEVWASASLDGAATWLENVRISLGVTSCIDAGGFNCGDYDTMDFHGGLFYRVWADNSPELPGNNWRPATDVATARVRVGNPAGPTVTGHTPTGTVNPAVGRVRVTFNTAIDPATFTAKDATFTGPAGGIPVIAVLPASGTGDMQFDVLFAKQGQTGRYTMVIGPDVRDTNGVPMDQDADGVPGEPEDVYRAQFALSGPRVTAHTPTGGAFDPVSFVRVTFSRPMDPATFTPKDVVSFVGPFGAIPVTAVTPVPRGGDAQFDLLFDEQTAPGNYTLVFGPNVLDTFGNAMDQNGNLTTGEVPGDRYTATFQIADPCFGYGEEFGYLGCVVGFLDRSIVGQPGTFTVLGPGVDLAGPVNLGANRFNFYGTSYTGANQMFLSNKGLITFGTATTAYENSNLTAMPTQRALAVLWDDWLKPGPNPSVIAQFLDFDNDGVDDWLILEWNQVQHFPSSPSGVTFQAILELNSAGPGYFMFNYLDLDAGSAAFDNGASATIGLKDAGTQGGRRIVVAFNQPASPYLGSGRALWISYFGAGPAPGSEGPSFSADSLALNALEATRPAAPAPADEQDLAALPTAVTQLPAFAPVDHVFGTDIPRADGGQAAEEADPSQLWTELFGEVRWADRMVGPRTPAGADAPV